MIADARELRRRKRLSRLFYEKVLCTGFMADVNEKRRHSDAYLKHIKEYAEPAEAEELEKVSPDFTSSTTGELGQLILGFVLEDKNISEHFVDVEVVNEKVIVYFSARAEEQIGSIRESLARMGSAELVLKPGSPIFTGVASNFFAFALEPNREEIKSLVVKNERRTNSFGERTTFQHLPEGKNMKHDLEQCREYGLNPAFFSDAAIEESGITFEDASEIYEAVFGVSVEEHTDEADTGDIVRALGYAQTFIPGKQLPKTASDFDLQLAKFNERHFADLADDYDLAEGESVDDLSEAEYNDLLEDYEYAFICEFHDLDAEELVEAVFTHTVSPLDEDAEHNQEVALNALLVAEDIEDELFEELGIDDEEIEAELQEKWKPVKRKPMGPLIRRAIAASKAKGKDKKKVAKEDLDRPQGVSKEIWEDATEIITEVGAQAFRKGMLRAMAVKGHIDNNQYNKNPAKGGGKTPSGYRYPGVKKWKKFVGKFPKGYSATKLKRKGT